MTANEIRKWHYELDAELEAGKFLRHHEVVRAKARIEIAAQLAELNDNLRRILAVPHFRADDEVTGG